MSLKNYLYIKLIKNDFYTVFIKKKQILVDFGNPLNIIKRSNSNCFPCKGLQKEFLRRDALSLRVKFSGRVVFA